MGNKKMEETRSEILENNRWTKVAWKGATEEYARTWAQFPTEHWSCLDQGNKLKSSGWLYLSGRSIKPRRQMKQTPKKRLHKSPTHPQNFPHPLDVLTEIRTLEGGKGMWYVTMYNNAQMITELITKMQKQIYFHISRKKHFSKNVPSLKKIVIINLNEKVIVSITFLDIHFC